MAFATPFHRRKSCHKEQKATTKTYFWHSFWKESSRNYNFASGASKFTEHLYNKATTRTFITKGVFPDKNIRL